MIIRVEKHTTGYSIVDNTGLNDPRLGLKARGLLGYLLTKPDNWEVTVQGIISQVPDGRDAVQSGLKELERFGYAEYRTVRGAGGRLDGKKWVIIERPTSKIADNELFASASSDHRQTGFPIIGKTDNRKNRLSENPQQVNTDTIVRTDYSVITEVQRGRKKNGMVPPVKAAPTSAPPVPAPPPASLTFSASGWSLENWIDNFLIRVPGSFESDAIYYYDRCRQWSQDAQSKSKDWIATAQRFMNEDLLRKKSTTKPDSTHASNSTNDKRGIDTVRATQRASRFAERNGFKGRPAN